jgi:hypothetical protein
MPQESMIKVKKGELTQVQQDAQRLKHTKSSLYLMELRKNEKDSQAKKDRSLIRKKR